MASNGISRPSFAIDIENSDSKNPLKNSSDRPSSGSCNSLDENGVVKTKYLIESNKKYSVDGPGLD